MSTEPFRGFDLLEANIWEAIAILRGQGHKEAARKLADGWYAAAAIVEGDD